MEENNYLETMKKRSIDDYQYFLKGIEIIRRLTTQMFEAYLVGGVVRDYFLGTHFNDIDIATSATPEEVKAIFPTADLSFKDLGCTKLIVEDCLFEITTFRVETYSQTRKPDCVNYSKKLTEDIFRRDFTVNALALTPNLQLKDLVDGKKDLLNHTIRVIGKGKTRFEEDPLRMFRALELIARYNFKVSYQTMKALENTCEQLFTLSNQRITESLKKILCSPYGKKAFSYLVYHDLFRGNSNYAFWAKRVNKKYDVLSMIEKFTLLYRMIGKVDEDTSFTHEELQQISTLLQTACDVETMPLNEMMVFEKGEEILLSADKINYLYNKEGIRYSKKIKKIGRMLPIRSKKDLLITPQDIISMGAQNEQIHEIQEEILKEVLEDTLENNESVLRLRVQQLLEKTRNNTSEEQNNQNE